MSAQPVFELLDGRYVGTELASGPWDRNAQHGGAPAALLARTFERLPAPGGLSLARLTYEFLRPVPIGPVEVRAEVTRPGRRLQLLDGSMLADGVEVVRARALRILAANSGGAHSEEIAPPPGPEEGRTGELPGFTPSEVRYGRDRDPLRRRRVRRGPRHGLVSPRASPRRGREALGSTVPRRGRRLRRRPERDAPPGRLLVHQPRPDPVRRSRAGRGVDLS